MKKSVSSLVVVAVLLFGAAGCSQTRQPTYADAYREALTRYQGTTAVTEDMTDRFVAFFSSHTHGNGTIPDPAELYGERLYFSDTLLTTENRSAALAHLRRMHDSTGSLEVEIIERLVQGQDVYLIWHMEATFQPLASEVKSSTVGMTHLRFGDDGRIVLQQDFWDSAAGLYRHVPVLGSFIGAVQSRFDSYEE